MKTLLAAVPKRTSIPILETILVKEGIAYATDLDVQVCQPLDAPDGLYNHNLVKAGILNNPTTDQAIDEFPILPEWPDITQSEALPLDDLEFLSRAQSTEETRFYLNGVYFAKNGDMVATDGNRMHMVETGIARAHGNILPKEAVKIAIMAMKEKKAKSCELLIAKDGFEVQIGDIQITTKRIDGTFPDYLRVIPKDSDYITEFKVKDIADSLKTIKATAKARGHTNYEVILQKGCMRTPCDTFTIPITAQFADDRERKFNPCFLAEMIDGVLHYSETPTDPIKIVDRCNTAVLMPFRK